MITNFFIKLEQNNQDFDKKEIDYLKDLVKDNIVKVVDNKYILNSKYKVGIIQIKNKFAKLLALTNEYQSINIDFEDLNGAYDGDLVLAKRVFHPRAKSKAKIIKILHREIAEILVYGKSTDYGIKLFSVKDNIVLGKAKYKNQETIKKNDVALVDANSFKVLKLFGNLDDPFIDEKISLYLYNEAYRLQENSSFTMHDFSHLIKKRVDLTSLPFFTIDPQGAKDYDDAIYFDEKDSTLYVAIADVSAFVEAGSLLDKQAYKRAFSIYLPHKVLPMLPPELSNDLCSLKPDVDRFAYVFKMKLDLQKNEVKSSELFEATINSKKRFTYGRIDRVLNGHFDNYNKIEKEIFDSILNLYQITKNLKNKRLQNGYDFRNDEFRLNLNKNGLLESISIESSSPSHSLIEECMLLANTQAAKRLANIGIFRIHEEPSLQAIQKLVDNANMLGLKVKLKSDVHTTITSLQKKAKAVNLSAEVDEMIIQSQQQARYGSKKQGHFGLGFDNYSHFTSPIRRYADLILHRILKTNKIPQDIDIICDNISQSERRINELVWDFEERKYARWAKQNLDNEFNAIISDTDKMIATLYKTMPGLRIYIDNYKGQKLYEKIKIKIKSSDIATKKVIGEIKYH